MSFPYQKLEEYLRPHNFSLNENNHTITGSLAAFCKLLLPQHYKKRDDKPDRTQRHHRN